MKHLRPITKAAVSITDITGIITAMTALIGAIQPIIATKKVQEV